MQDIRMMSIDERIVYIENKLDTLTCLEDEGSYGLRYDSYDNGIYGWILLKQGMKVRFAHDCDDETPDMVVFHLWDKDGELLLSNISNIDILVEHLNKYLN